ncbi:hypothetical protein QCN27_19910 [Cereibacter sp. SYSU M97828]|nr:hypothetical protein [Cereibacter flavus]
MTHILNAVINGRRITFKGSEALLTTKLVQVLHIAYPEKSGFACIPETYSMQDIALAVEDEGLEHVVCFVMREGGDSEPSRDLNHCKP